MTMKKRLLAFLFACFAIFSLAQTPGQTLRGNVTDADTGKPLVGATVSLLSAMQPEGTNTNESGSYSITSIAVGRYQVQFSHLGFAPLTIAEVLVESGRETVLNVQLREKANELKEVVVKASTNAQSTAPISRLNFSVEEQFRFPGTNFDPARLAMAYPGVTGENDGTNIISVRGNSPNALQWRLEGVEIVNPNHTANAGTFGDRPTAAGGGVNILSAQLLGSSSLLTGAFPAQYGNALGGILDMSFRKGNDQRHELITQAGFIGIEAAAEGPLSVGNRPSTTTNQQSPSFLVNYRYSFTGLLTSLGVDFGDEETAFQDLAFHVALPGKKGGNFALFGMGGKSSTLYRSPTDSATIEKELFNIDFQSKMGAAGMTYLKPLGKRSVWRTVAVISALEHGRTADLYATNEQRQLDDLRQRKLALQSIFSKKINSQHRFRLGISAVQDHDSSLSFFKNDLTILESKSKVDGWVLQPFAEWQVNVGERFDITMGVQGSHYAILKNGMLLEPRINVSYKPNGMSSLSLAYGAHSQSLPNQVWAFAKAGQLSAQKAHHLVLGYQASVTSTLWVKAEAYAQILLDLPVFEVGETRVSSINFTDFSQTYLGASPFTSPISIANTAIGRNIGLDVSAQKYLTDKTFFLLAGSVYRSQYSDDGASWVEKPNFRPTRFDGGHSLNATIGREGTKQKKGKTIIRGISGRVVWIGGFRETPIDTAASAEVGYTVYFQEETFNTKLDDYFRIDLRLYKKWNKSGRNSMLSLDIQNVTGRENIQYHYYDTVQGKVLEKRQLSLIPILTWRGEF